VPVCEVGVEETVQVGDKAVSHWLGLGILRRACAHLRRKFMEILLVKKKERIPFSSRP